MSTPMQDILSPCGLVQGAASCAVTAKGWEWAQRQHSLLLEQVLLGQAGVWARMGPCDKQALVQRMAAAHPSDPKPATAPHHKATAILDPPFPGPAPLSLPGKGASMLMPDGKAALRGNISNGLPAWGLGAQIAFCGDGANDAGALKVLTSPLPILLVGEKAMCACLPVSVFGRAQQTLQLAWQSKNTCRQPFGAKNDPARGV